MMSRKPWEVNAAMLEPTWAATNSPAAAPAIASPLRSSTWANFLTRNRMVVTHGARKHQARTFCSPVEDISGRLNTPAGPPPPLRQAGHLPPVYLNAHRQLKFKPSYVPFRFALPVSPGNEDRCPNTTRRRAAARFWRERSSPISANPRSIAWSGGFPTTAPPLTWKARIPFRSTFTSSCPMKACRAPASENGYRKSNSA